MRSRAFAPELTYYVTGLSKSFGAGLRVAYLRAPTPRQTQRLAGALRATTVMASPFTVSLATQWVVDGTALEMLDAIRSESRARQAIAARVLGAWPYDAHPDGFHLWLPIPGEGGWSASELALQLRNQGIAAVGECGVLDRRQSAQRDARVPRRLEEPRRMRGGAAHHRRHARTSASFCIRRVM